MFLRNVNACAISYLFRRFCSVLVTPSKFGRSECVLKSVSGLKTGRLNCLSAFLYLTVIGTCILARYTDDETLPYHHHIAPIL